MARRDTEEESRPAVMEPPMVQERSVEEPVAERRVVGRPVGGPAVAQTDMVATDAYGERRAGAWRAVQAVYLVFAVIEGLIAIRFILKALGANPTAGFSSFMYNVTDPLLAPFAGMFGTPAASNGGVLEIHAIVGFVVYALLAWLVTKLVRLLLGETRTGIVTSARRVDYDPPR